MTNKKIFILGIVFLLLGLVTGPLFFPFGSSSLIIKSIGLTILIGIFLCVAGISYSINKAALTRTESRYWSQLWFIAACTSMMNYLFHPLRGILGVFDIIESFYALAPSLEFLLRIVVVVLILVLGEKLILKLTKNTALRIIYSFLFLFIVKLASVYLLIMFFGFNINIM